MTKIQAKIINDYFKKHYGLPKSVILMLDDNTYLSVSSFKDDTNTYSIINQIEDDLCLNVLEDVKVFKERNEEENGKEEYETDYIA